MSGTPDRRRFMAQATAALAAAGLVAAPKLAKAVTGGSDAELIGLCHRIVALEDEYERMAEPFYDAVGDAPPEVEERERAIIEEQHDLKDRAARLPATTDEGRRAKALALATCFSRMADGSLCYAGSIDLLAWSLARDLAGPENVPGEPREPLADRLRKESDAMFATLLSSPQAAS